MAEALLARIAHSVSPTSARRRVATVAGAVVAVVVPRPQPTGRVGHTVRVKRCAGAILVPKATPRPACPGVSIAAGESWKSGMAGGGEVGGTGGEGRVEGGGRGGDGGGGDGGGGEIESGVCQVTTRESELMVMEWPDMVLLTTMETVAPGVARICSVRTGTASEPRKLLSCGPHV